MTNSLNTPIEALEIFLPIEILEYSLRKESGGKGKFSGGDGLTRTYKFLKDAHVSILSDRRRKQPYGLFGGEPGKSGENILLSKKFLGGSRGAIFQKSPPGRRRQEINLNSKVNIEIKAGDILIIKTPGGGGYGKKE